MKTVQSLDELHRLALGRGAEVVLPGGKRFNASQQRIPEPPRPRAAPPAAAPVAPPVPAPAPTMSAAEVQAMLDARDRVWMRQLETVIGAFKAAISAKPEPGEKEPTEWSFKVTYLADGEIDTVHAKAGPVTG